MAKKEDFSFEIFTHLDSVFHYISLVFSRDSDLTSTNVRPLVSGKGHYMAIILVCFFVLQSNKC